MRRVLFATIKIILTIIAFSACSKHKHLSTPEKVYISVVFTPEGFCNLGYNDITLKAIEILSQKYGYSYSFSVPDTIEDGMAYYKEWCNIETDDNTRCLFIFSSNIYEKYLAEAQHPSQDSRKDVLMFEVEKELPYAYTFAMTYYGAAYMVGSYYLSKKNANFQVIAANQHLNGLDHLIDGLTAAIEESSVGKINFSYLSESPDGGLDEDETAYVACKLVDADTEDNVFIPYAGASNLGVYRFSEFNHRTAVGIDCIDPELYSNTLLCMNKRIDLALDDFLRLWIIGENPPKYTFYTLESGRVTVDRASALDPYSDKLDEIEKKAISIEKEYFSQKSVNE